MTTPTSKRLDHTPGPGLCGCCVVAINLPTTWDRTVAIEYCPLHAAAPEMRLLLQMFVNWTGAPVRSQGAIDEFGADARALLAKIEQSEPPA